MAYWYSMVPFLLAILALFLYCEIIAYYLTIFLYCQWPDSQPGSAKVFVIADTHLLGVNRGHWFDKLRREWQMHRAFKSAITIFNPDAVFFLGDLFDEGQWSTSEQFRIYHQRFNSLFVVDSNSHIQRYIVLGNHDIGFHYAIFPSRLNWFIREFDRNSTVDLIELKGNLFVLVNSMAMQDDGCRLCHSASVQLEKIASKLRCAHDSSTCERGIDRLNVPYSQPILMQHFPLFRLGRILTYYLIKCSY